MLSNFYIDNANYQENEIPRQNKADGHEIKIIASTEVYIKNITIGYTNPGEYINEDGIPVTRLPYRKILNFNISKRVRAYPGLYGHIENFSPDLILFHGAAAYALITAAKYVKNHRGVRLLVDSHEDLLNSATNFLSKHVLHRLFYKGVVQFSLAHIEKILYITYETKIFLENVYNIPPDKLSFFPLGGRILTEDERNTVRSYIRRDLGIKDHQILIIHSGKLDSKKRTREIVEAFCKVRHDDLRMIIIGSLDNEVSKEIDPFISSDPRIRYLGWMKPDSLRKYLMAGDLYVQLGGQSVTMQNALCCGCAAALFPFESHKFLLDDSVFYISNKDDLTCVLDTISQNRSLLEDKRKRSFNIARNLLDYKKIASILYHPAT